MSKLIENLDKIIKETAEKINFDVKSIQSDFENLKNEFISIVEKSLDDLKEPEEITYKWGDKIKLSNGLEAIFLGFYNFDRVVVVTDGSTESSIIYKSTIVEIIE